MLGGLMLEHFGVAVKEDNFLNRDHYAIYTEKDLEKYSLAECEEHRQRCLENFDINMKHFQELDYSEFCQEIDSFLTCYPSFEKVDSLNDYRDVQGYYIMVLDLYKQIYIGTTNNIYKRIKQHWNNKKEFDRLIFPIYNVSGSVLSIDCFGALDTTRIYVFPTVDLYSMEDEFICFFSPKFLSNRIPGGIPSSMLDILLRMNCR